MSEAPALLKQWEDVLDDLLDRTARFPKVVRFTFAARIENLALDVLEAVVSARYATGRERAAALSGANSSISRLRVLIRLSHRRRYLDHRSYEHVSRGLDEAGRMVGGWHKASAGAGSPRAKA